MNGEQVAGGKRRQCSSLNPGFLSAAATAITLCQKMNATILTDWDVARFFFIVISVFALIPFLAGVLVRIMIPHTLLSGILGALSATALSGTKLFFEGGWGNFGNASLLPILPEIIFFTVIISAFAIVGVRSASAYYSGLAEGIETRHNKGRRATASPSPAP